MDLLFRVVTPRNIVLAALIVGFAAFGYKNRAYPVQRYLEWRYPPQDKPGPMGKAILAEAEERRKRHVQAAHDRLLSVLQKSKEEGFDVSSHELQARKAYALNAQGNSRKALTILYQLEMDIPRKKVQYIPMNLEDEPLALPQDQTPKPVPELPRKRRRQRR